MAVGILQHNPVLILLVNVSYCRQGIFQICQNFEDYKCVKFLLLCSAHYLLSYRRINTRVKRVEKLEEIIVICYIKFRTTNFHYFLSYSFPDLHSIE
jgi:hypothetical protein